MKIAIPDLISNSYFPAIAAAELGCWKEEGLDLTLELLFPVTRAMEALRNGQYDFVAGTASSVLTAFPEWQGAKILAALAERMYWFLVLRTDLHVPRDDVQAVKGLRIGAAPGVDVGLKRLLREVGIDPEKDVQIAPVPGTGAASVSFGVTAAQALSDGKLDGFWANGMGAEVAVRSGAGTIVLDIRRGDGPKPALTYTFPALVTRTELVDRQPEKAAACIRGLIKAQNILKADPDRATEVGRKVFPEMEASLIAELIRRDIPYYSPAVPKPVVDDLQRFAVDMGLLKQPAPYEDVVATQFSDLWA